MADGSEHRAENETDAGLATFTACADSSGLSDYSVDVAKLYRVDSSEIERLAIAYGRFWNRYSDSLVGLPLELDRIAKTISRASKAAMAGDAIRCELALSVVLELLNIGAEDDDRY